MTSFLLHPNIHIMNILHFIKKSNYEYFAEITMTDTYNNERFFINVIKRKIHLDVEASITNMIMNPNEEWLARKKTHHLT
jgi:hypothetical protein